MIETILYLYANGARRVELTEYRDLEYGYLRNAFMRGGFVYNGNNQPPEVYKHLVEGSEIQIYRKGHFETVPKLVYKAEIIRVEKTVSPDNTKTYVIEMDPYANRELGFRSITKTYTNQQEESIAWDMINTTQTDTKSGTFTVDQVDFGYTQGTLTPTNNERNRTFTNKNILEALQQLADVKDIAPNEQILRGFRISPDLKDPSERVFSYEAPYGQTRNVVYSNSELKFIKQIKDISSYANRGIATSSSAGQGIYNNVSDVNLDTRKMREVYYSSPNISDIAELEDIAEDKISIAAEGDTLYIFDINENDPYTGQYRVGDTIGISYASEDDFLSIELSLIVFEITIRVSDGGSSVEKTYLKTSVNRPTNINESTFERLASTINNLKKEVVNTNK